MASLPGFYRDAGTQTTMSTTTKDSTAHTLFFVETTYNYIGIFFPSTLTQTMKNLFLDAGPRMRSAVIDAFPELARQTQDIMIPDCCTASAGRSVVACVPSTVPSSVGHIGWRTSESERQKESERLAAVYNELCLARDEAFQVYQQYTKDVWEDRTESESERHERSKCRQLIWLERSLAAEEAYMKYRQYAYHNPAPIEIVPGPPVVCRVPGIAVNPPQRPMMDMPDSMNQPELAMTEPKPQEMEWVRAGMNGHYVSDEVISMLAMQVKKTKFEQLAQDNSVALQAETAQQPQREATNIALNHQMQQTHEHQQFFRQLAAMRTLLAQQNTITNHQAPPDPISVTREQQEHLSAPAAIPNPSECERTSAQLAWLASLDCGRDYDDQHDFCGLRDETGEQQVTSEATAASLSPLEFRTSSVHDIPYTSSTTPKRGGSGIATGQTKMLSPVTCDVGLDCVSSSDWWDDKAREEYEWSSETERGDCYDTSDEDENLFDDDVFPNSRDD